jgi:hypothetical protein
LVGFCGRRYHFDSQPSQFAEGILIFPLARKGYDVTSSLWLD